MYNARPRSLFFLNRGPRFFFCEEVKGCFFACGCDAVFSVQNIGDTLRILKCKSHEILLLTLLEIC
jgi:hypothetical protein